MNQHHPYVSEVHEGKPAFEWCVLGVVIVALVVAFLGYTMAATVIIAVTAIVTALLRIIVREKSPWKVRSVLFDAIIGIGLGLGLLLLYFAPSLFWIPPRPRRCHVHPPQRPSPRRWAHPQASSACVSTPYQR